MKLQILFFLLAITLVQSQEQLNSVQNISESMEAFVGEVLDFQFWTGYIPVGLEGQENTSLFFSMTTKHGETLEKTSKDTPVIFWFNGGPGCSSQYGNWVEIGPIQLNEQLEPSFREFSWNKKALLIFIDQPLNSGFSYGKDTVIASAVQATSYIKTFMTAFYNNENFKHLIQNPTYFFGESYAGHYIPSFARMMLEEKPVQNLNFLGVGIGDGWTDPLNQITSMDDYFFNTGVAGQGQREEIKKKQDQAVKDIISENYADATHIFDEITDDTAQYGEIDQYNFNYYNLEGQEDPYTQQYFVSLFQNKEFRKSYGIPTFIPDFSNCNDDVYTAFANDFTASYKNDVEYLLAQKQFKVLLFNGQLDIIVNGAGAQDWINSMDWNYLQKWQYAKKIVWNYPAESLSVIGNYQNYENFTYVNIYNAGHMVPSDQPLASSVMLQTFLDWDW